MRFKHQDHQIQPAIASTTYGRLAAIDFPTKGDVKADEGAANKAPPSRKLWVNNNIIIIVMVVSVGDSQCGVTNCKVLCFLFW